MVPWFGTEFPDQNRAALNTIFFDFVSVPGHPKSGTTGQRSGQRQPGVAWPARLTHPTKPAWPAGCGGWLASRPAGQSAGCSLYLGG
jgi:hypothetical protein